MTPQEARIAQRLAAIAAARPITLAPATASAASGRREPRRAVYRHGRLVVAGGVEVDCIIVDVSDNGARVQLPGATGLPEFVLLKTVVTGSVKRARVVWRSDSAAGLSFRVEQNLAFAKRAIAPRPKPAPEPQPVNPDTE
ncbi:MAG: PilZ domain-containing protein [Parvularculaceae bacterium]|nr:PilZ domain-containing protein [Parvularculaceae bacterium]